MGGWSAGGRALETAAQREEEEKESQGTERSRQRAMRDRTGAKAPI